VGLYRLITEVEMPAASRSRSAAAAALSVSKSATICSVKSYAPCNVVVWRLKGKKGVAGFFTISEAIARILHISRACRFG
jgi:hypothetical protein